MTRRQPTARRPITRRAVLAALCAPGVLTVACSGSSTSTGTSGSAAGPAAPSGLSPVAGAVPAAIGDVTTTRIAQLTGPGAVNDTAAAHVAGADLGSMFRHDGKLWFVFGDTFGIRDADLTGGGGDDWRSNAMAWSTDTDPDDGITFGGFVTDPQTGWALEMVPGEKIDNSEMTKIPTYGFSANGAMYLAFMSVRHWGEPGEWEVNFSGLARSDDGGATWTQLLSPRWAGESNFVQVSVTQIGDELYFHGVTHGRHGAVHLMKVPVAQVEQQAAYRYFAGTAADGTPRWNAAESEATALTGPEVGELSVAWDERLQRWLMTATAGDGSGTSLRESPTPWGPWSEPRVLVSATDVPGLYSPYLAPGLSTDDGAGGSRVYFTLSVWDPYQVFWYRADLGRAGAAGTVPATGSATAVPTSDTGTAG